MAKQKQLSPEQIDACEEIYVLEQNNTAIKVKKERRKIFRQIQQLMRDNKISQTDYDSFITNRELSPVTTPPSKKIEESKDKNTTQQKSEKSPKVITKLASPKNFWIDQMLVRIKQAGRTEGERGSYGADFGPHGYPNFRPHENTRR